HTAAALMYGAAGIAAGLELLAEASSGGAAKAKNWCGIKAVDASSLKPVYAAKGYENFNSFEHDEELNNFLSMNHKRRYFESKAIKDNFESLFTIYSSVNSNNTSPSL